MLSQSQIEMQCLNSRADSQVRHHHDRKLRDKRRRLRLLCLPFLLLGIGGLVYYITLPMPVEQWLIGFASGIVIIVAFLLPNYFTE